MRLSSEYYCSYISYSVNRETDRSTSVLYLAYDKQPSVQPRSYLKHLARLFLHFKKATAVNTGIPASFYLIIHHARQLLESCTTQKNFTFMPVTVTLMHAKLTTISLSYSGNQSKDAIALMLLTT
jgi:hypothetical protein